MSASLLFSISGGIVTFLNVGHLYLSMATDTFDPSDPKIAAALKTTPSVAAKKADAHTTSTVHKNLLGTHVGLSMGGAFVGLTIIYLAQNHTALLSAHFFKAMSLAYLGAMTFVGHAWWARIPAIGFTLATALFLAASFM